MRNADSTKRSPTIGWLSGSADSNAAGRRFRMIAPIEMLTSRGHAVDVFDPDEEGRYETLVFAKAYSAEHLALARRAKARGTKVIFDLCDNHFFNPNGLAKYDKAAASIREMAGLADRVTCTTETLARVIIDEVETDSPPVVIEDTAEAGHSAPGFQGGVLSLLWFGSHGSPNAPSGLGDIRLIQQQLERLAQRSDVELVVCSNNEQKYRELIAPMAIPSRYMEWSPQKQQDALAAAHAIVLPASRNPFTDSKSHNRLTTALGTGLPVMATGLPAYQVLGAFCTLDDWDAGFVRLLEDYLGEKARAQAAGAFIRSRWSPDVLAPAWEAALGLRGGLPRRNAASAVHGALDVSGDAGIIQGWARNARSPHPVEVALLSKEGAELARVRADRPRPDLQEAGMANPDCGFRFIAPGTVAGVAVVEILSGVTIGHVDPVLPTVGVSPRTPADVKMEAAGAEAQSQLLAAVMSAETDISALRSTLARLVVSLGDAPHLAQRVRKSLSGSDETAPGASH